MTRPDRRSTIADVARQAGVAKSTASLAFSAPARVAPPTLERVRDAASRLGYAPSVMAASLRSGRNNLVGLLAADMLNPHTAATLKAVEAACRARGRIVITATCDQGIAEEREILSHFRSLRIRGVILIGSGFGAAYTDGLRAHDVEFVTLDQHLPGLGADHVGLDDRLAMQTLVGHLAALGHRRIGHVAGTRGLWSAEERAAGMREACSAAGLDPADCPIVHCDYRADGGRDAALTLLDRGERPTAIVAANNVTAIGALRALRARGLSCPGDVSLVSVDFLPWGDLIAPEMTCTIQPVTEMAEQAVTWLVERLDRPDGTGAPPGRKATFAPRMHIGASTASPAL